MMLTSRMAALALCSLALVACDRRSADAPAPRAEATQPVVPSSPDPSVPAAKSVVTTPTAPTAQDSAAGRSTGTLTAGQESNAMPMPGQVNNHSTTALDPPRRAASSP